MIQNQIKRVICYCEDWFKINSETDVRINYIPNEINNFSLNKIKKQIYKN